MIKLIVRIIALFALPLALSADILAQSSPGIVTGQTPNANQWNGYFAAKQDYLNATPLLPAGIFGVTPIVNTPGVGGPPSTTLSMLFGQSIVNPGTGVLENASPVNQVGPITNYQFTTADFYKYTQRTNNNSPMTDTLPNIQASVGQPLPINGTKIAIKVVDSTTTDTLVAGPGTTIMGQPSFVLTAGRDIELVYDAAHTNWSAQYNSNMTPTAVLPVGTTPGSIPFWNGTAWASFAGNTTATNAFFQETSAGVPSWTTFTPATNSITNTLLAQAPASSIKSNPTAATNSDQDLGISNCNTSNTSLSWTSGAGFGCSQIVTPGQLPGTTTNDNAAAGNVGEFASAAASVAIGSSAISAVVGLTLTPGDWDISGTYNVQCAAGLTGFSIIYGNLGLTVNSGNNVIDDVVSELGAGMGFPCASVQALALPRGRLSIAINTQVILNVEACCFNGTVTATGFVRARRRR